jgi:hypothetical protein
MNTTTETTSEKLFPACFQNNRCWKAYKCQKVIMFIEGQRLFVLLLLLKESIWLFKCQASHHAIFFPGHMVTISKLHKEESYNLLH